MLTCMHTAATIKVGIMNSSQVTIKREKQMTRSIRRKWQKNEQRQEKTNAPIDKEQALMKTESSKQGQDD